MRYIDVPAKVIECVVSSQTGLGAWPYDDGTGDPYWTGGSTPRDYQWRITMSVTPQTHSSPKTRQPKIFDGMDISVGDYIADREEGVALKIISIDSKTSTSVTCVVEDFLRYNTYRFVGGTGVGIFSVPNTCFVFSLNEQSLPVVDPIPSSGAGSNFYANLMSRFQNIEETENFLLDKVAHGFVVDDLISADPATNSFEKTDSAHPYVVGSVSYVATGPDQFMINPIQKINNYPDLIGDVGDIIYADPNNPGQYALNGVVPILIKLRNSTPSQSVGQIAGGTSASGSIFNVNEVACTLVGTTALDCANAINLTTSQHGIVASMQAASSFAQSDVGQWVYGEPALMTPTAGPYANATINGVNVIFSTNTNGLSQYSAEYSLEEDMAIDINAANIPNIVATTDSNKLIITNTQGGSITIVNGNADISGNYFAGSMSGSGVPLFTAASSNQYIKLVAPDARAISLSDISGSAVYDFGLVSVENGVKAAGLYIEQGIRQAATYVVPNIPARDGLTALFGDQCYVQDAGNGEWAFYIYTLDSEWIQLVNKDASDTDAKTIEIEVDHTSAVSGAIHTISDGSRVSFVTVTVTEAFDDPAATITVGDTGNQSRLMSDYQNDITALGDYSTTPSYVYNFGSDTTVSFYLATGNSTTGHATISITYS
jgi:hypothetical protein